MNYIWTPLIDAIGQGKNIGDIYYSVGGGGTAPGMECWYSPHGGRVKDADASAKIKVNPYYRFETLFEALLNPDYMDEVKIDGYLSNTDFNYTIEHRDKKVTKKNINKDFFRNNIKMLSEWFGDILTPDDLEKLPENFSQLISGEAEKHYKPDMLFGDILTRIYNPAEEEETEEYIFTSDFSKVIEFKKQKLNIISANISELCDIITHLLAQTDTICGMAKQDFQVMAVMREMEAGLFGYADCVKLFTLIERRIIADSLLTLYRTSDIFGCIRRIFKSVEPDVYIQIRNGEELVLYAQTKETEEKSNRINFLISMFVPVGYKRAVHWEYTYGVVLEKEKLEEFVL
jgi:hypothetical protein